MCWAGRTDFTCQRDAAEKSECETLIIPDSVERFIRESAGAPNTLNGSLIWRTQHFRHQVHWAIRSCDGCSTPVQVGCLLSSVRLQMRQKKGGCWAAIVADTHTVSSLHLQPDRLFQWDYGSTAHAASFFGKKSLSLSVGGMVTHLEATCNYMWDITYWLDTVEKKLTILH